MIVTTKISELLFPMNLKKYMLFSFATLWTVLLIIALIATLIHQVNYQKSGEQIYLEWEVKDLKEDLQKADLKSRNLQLDINNLKTSYNEMSNIQGRQQHEIQKGKDTIKALRDFYSYIIDPEVLYYADIE